jgi:hypothetical protein
MMQQNAPRSLKKGAFSVGFFVMAEAALARHQARLAERGERVELVRQTSGRLEDESSTSVTLARQLAKHKELEAPEYSLYDMLPCCWCCCPRDDNN